MIRYTYFRFDRSALVLASSSSSGHSVGQLWSPASSGKSSTGTSVSPEAEDEDDIISTHVGADGFGSSSLAAGAAVVPAFPVCEALAIEWGEFCKSCSIGGLVSPSELSP